MSSVRSSRYRNTEVADLDTVALIRQSRKEFPWKEWADFCWKYHICIINWPENVPWPGGPINVRGLHQRELTLLVSRARLDEALAIHGRPSLEETEFLDQVYPTIVRLDGTLCTASHRRLLTSEQMHSGTGLSSRWARFPLYAV